jgi:hypothetical protein
MTDDISQLPSGKKFKLVDHSKITYVQTEPGIIGFDYNGHSYEHQGSSCLHFNYGYSPYFGTADVSTEYRDSKQRQINDAMDRFFNDNEVDNILNLAEAHQIPGTLKSLSETVNNPDVKAALKLRPGDPLPGRNLRKVLKVSGRTLKRSSSAFLAYSFGLAPLLSDMRKMSKACQSFKSDMAKFNQSRSRPSTVSTRFSGQAIVNRAFGSRIGTSHYQYRGGMQALTQPTRIITILGVNKEQYDSKAFANLDYVLRKFGGSGPASYIWEKIPYSFVVDWFADLRGVMNAIDNVLTGNTKRIMDACISEHYKVRIPSCLTSDYGLATLTLPVNHTPMSWTTVERYTREPFVPTSKVVASGRFGKKQLALAGALLYQKIANR